MKPIDQIERELSEMWDALLSIPFNEPGREAAIRQGHEVEARMRAEHEAQGVFWRKVVNGTIPFNNLTFTAKPLDSELFQGDEWIVFRLDRVKISEGYKSDDVFYVTDPIGEPVACYLSTLALKIY